MRSHESRFAFAVAAVVVALASPRALAWKHRGEGWWQPQVTYKINDRCTQFQNVVNNAANCWNIKPGFRLVNGGFTPMAACQTFTQHGWQVPLCAPLPPDGMNVIDWCPGARDGNTLAETFSVTVMNPDGTCCRAEADICIYSFFCDNQGHETPIQWHSGAGAPPAGAFDMESVLKHEFGHFVGLNHTCFVGRPRPVMSDSIGPGVRRRRLRADDIAGFCDLYVANPQPQWRAAGNPYSGNPSRKALALEGTTNAAGDELADVVLVNGSPGSVVERSLALPVGAPITVGVVEPPSRLGLPTPFALYFWLGPPTDATATEQAAGTADLGLSPFPTPINRGLAPQPFRLLNNTPVRALGTPSFPSAPAPFSVTRGTGFGRPIVLTTAGIIRDDLSLDASRFSCTNGIVIQIL
jgi:matrixin